MAGQALAAWCNSRRRRRQTVRARRGKPPRRPPSRGWGGAGLAGSTVQASHSQSRAPPAAAAVEPGRGDGCLSTCALARARARRRRQRARQPQAAAVPPRVVQRAQRLVSFLRRCRLTAPRPASWCEREPAETTRSGARLRPLTLTLSPARAGQHWTHRGRALCDAEKQAGQADAACARRARATARSRRRGRSRETGPA